MKTRGEIYVLSVMGERTMVLGTAGWALRAGRVSSRYVQPIAETVQSGGAEVRADTQK